MILAKDRTMTWTAKWIRPKEEMGDVPPVYGTRFAYQDSVCNARLFITAMGVYEAVLNGKRVGEFRLAPGWTSYHKRLQYQEYDVTAMLKEQNELTVTVGKGWYHTHLMDWEDSGDYQAVTETPLGLLAQLVITDASGKQTVIATDEAWKVSEGPVRFSEIYDGEIYDANITPELSAATEVFDGPWDTLIPQQGEEVHTQEQFAAACIFTTPKGETVVDFGQEITGVVRVDVHAGKGEVVDLSFAEVMDKEGNFYNENYRAAKCQYIYTCRDGFQSYESKLTFYGFRYLRVNRFPGGPHAAAPENFTAVVLHSEMKRTGYLSCSSPLLNRLFDNVIWGQKGNYLDVPTDCPQRNERLGWTGDVQVFARTACLNYDVEKFFTKWLADLRADQGADGRIGTVIPDVRRRSYSGAAWGDVATICPWQLYLAYGDPKILGDQFDCMKSWISYIEVHSKDRYLWTGGKQYGDWLGLDAPEGSYKGSTREDFLASAFYAYSVSLVVKAGKILGKNVAYYEELYGNIVAAFRKAYPVYMTQTECVLAVYFHLAEDCQAAADQLARMVEACGTKLQTGFVGTPYLLHALSEYGYTKLAYSLLLREAYPSWLYAVKKGATTIWEHWDGIMENGDFWSSDMNSFNHYAYGCVLDWVYTVAAGINTVEEYPGYARVKIAPHPDSRLEWLRADLDTRHGHVRSRWEKAGKFWRYEITTPVEARIMIDGVTHHVGAGSYNYYSPME